MDRQPELVSDNDKLIAMLSHLSFFLGSIILPLIFYAIYKQKSNFITFHSIQSLFFQIMLIVVSAFVGIIAGVCGAFILISSDRSGTPIILSTFQIIIFSVLGLFLIGCTLWGIAYAIYLSIDSCKGGLKKYPIIGNIIYKRVYGIQ